MISAGAASSGPAAKNIPNRRIFAYASPEYAAGKEYGRELMLEVLKLNLIFMNAGLWGTGRRVLPRRRHAGCFAVSSANLTIAPDGRLLDCSHDLTHGYGDVRDAGFFAVKRSFLRERFSAECRSCRLLPVCHGGCRIAEISSAAMTQCLPEKTIIRDLMELQADCMRTG